MSRVDVAVVGAGASGLGAAAALQRSGLEPVVFERDNVVGGTWDRRYDRLRLHTIRRFSALPFSALPRSEPRYVSKDAFAEYLREYTRQEQLDVRVDQAVERVTRSNGEWSFLAGGKEHRARTVVIATGRHNEPRFPDWPGRDEFRGRLLHSVDYRSGREFEAARVLVVGIGNTGAEVAADLVEQGVAHVAIAVRTTPPITKRELLGIPVQLFGMALMPFPPAAVDRVGAVLRRFGTGDLSKYGLGAEAWGPFTARRPPVIDVGFLEQLKARRIEVRPALAKLTAAGVVYTDGREEAFDVVVAATGFTTGLENLLASTGALDERGLPRSREPEPGLFFAGYDETPRGQLFESGRGARRLAKDVRQRLDGGASARTRAT